MIVAILEINGQEYVNKKFDDTKYSEAKRFLNGLNKTYGKFLMNKDHKLFIDRSNSIQRTPLDELKVGCVQMDLKGRIIEEYDSLFEAANSVGVRASDIKRAFGRDKKGIPYTCRGFRWAEKKKLRVETQSQNVKYENENG